ncbi:hypothetical protein BDA99DRAFT_529258 [Phascolomyces articulosus]|uniref:C2H2-type domain-containing protein n=1 Tax=Phascolomyces articulosus TaxID=60185 RepID=A0AAD5JVT2_9FUNG|nr:hypothetical protein BDA99DRAFT_529258 [Phascolomyces articulosus]
MANETFLNTTSCTDQLFNQHDFCLNDSLSGSQQDYHHASLQAAFTIPALQVQPEEDTFLPTPVPSNASTPPSFQQDYTTMFMATSPALSMDSSIMMNYSSFPTEQSPHYSYHDLHHQQQPTTITTTTRRSHGTRRRTPKVHQCPHCPHTSNRANNMKEHILTHDPNRPKKFPCPKCGKRFARKHDMKRHSKSPHH